MKIAERKTSQKNEGGNKLWHFQIYLVGIIVQRRLPLAVLPAVRLTNLQKLRLPAALPISL